MLHGEPLLDGVGRDLTPMERELLAAMLSVNGLEAAAVLHRQMSTARAAPSCRCGCGSIYLLIDHDASERADSLEERVLVEGDVLNDIGEPVGGLLLFHDGGWLSNLEVYSLVDRPLPLPAPARTRLRLYH